MNLAIIPARFGSKGLPRKNVSLIGGKPMIQYSIEAALQSKYFGDLVVSTDDMEVKKISSELGVPKIFHRGSRLSQDDTSMVEVVVDVLEKYKEKKGEFPETFVLLQPTSPLRTSIDIDNSYEILKKRKSKSLISVSLMHEHPYECLIEQKKGWTYLETPKEKFYRRQDYSNNYFFINGAIYMLNTSFFLENKSFIIEGKSVLYKMPKNKSIDIDNKSDLDIVKLFIENNNKFS